MCMQVFVYICLWVFMCEHVCIWHAFPTAVLSFVTPRGPQFYLLIIVTKGLAYLCSVWLWKKETKYQMFVLRFSSYCWSEAVWGENPGGQAQIDRRACTVTHAPCWWKVMNCNSSDKHVLMLPGPLVSFFCLNIYLFIYLAVLGLSSSMWNLQYSLRHVASLDEAHGM